jgi:hypothetical protein
MTLGIIECVLFMWMVGLIWVMLDIFSDDHHADDKRQGSASPDHRDRLHQSVLSSLALQKQRVMVFLPAALIERLRNAAYWTGDRPLVDLVAEAIEDVVTQIEEANRGALPQRASPLKREATTRRALSSPLH